MYIVVVRGICVQISISIYIYMHVHLCIYVYMYICRQLLSEAGMIEKVEVTPKDTANNMLLRKEMEDLFAKQLPSSIYIYIKDVYILLCSNMHV